MSKHWGDQSLPDKIQTGYNQVTKILEGYRKIPKNKEGKYRRPPYDQGYVEGLELAQIILLRCSEHKEKQDANS